AQVQIRQARLLKDQVDLSRTTIFSPIDGVVIQRAIDVGQTVAASFNAPVLFQIANDLRKMQIHAMVSEADIGGVEVGQDVTFNVDAFPLRTFQGRVEQVRFAATTNQNVVTYATVISVPNDELKLRPGMTATVSIINSRQRDAVRIPNTALRFRPPEGALVKSNTPSASVAVQGAAVDPAASTPAGGGEGTPGREGMRRRSSGGEGGGGGFGRREGGGGPGGGGRSGGMASSRRTIYKLEPVEGSGSDKGFQLVPVEVRLGITDGTFTEVKEGLKEGDEIAIGVVGATGAPTAPGGQQNPFGGPGMRR
ncbi:MAG: efflux RND transporter periplasmic adaptor subunit, partial [Verrucomicrobia bacterium]|nr:efflux RND transporter periplasmic adaptor subunit [Verrucomicrobiota bacterium]